MPLHITYYVAQSLDGFIARPNGAVDWLPAFEEGGPDYGFHDFLDTIDVLIMGRGTYEHVLGYGAWPYKHPTVVCAHGPLNAKHGVLQWQHDLPQLMSWLDGQGYKRAWLVGGGTLASAFAVKGALDQVVTTIVPVCLGDGIQLLEALDGDFRLNLSEYHVFPNGLVQIHYTRD